MATRRRYTDEDKAAALLVLTTNDGNLRRTARDTGVPLSTLRHWRNSGVLDSPAVVERAVHEAENYIARAERLRDRALTELERRINEGDVTARDLYTMFGILDDKVTRARGLATSRTETVVHNPDLGEAGKALAGFLQDALGAARQRHDEIIESKVGEQAAVVVEVAPVPALSTGEEE